MLVGMAAFQNHFLRVTFTVLPAAPMRSRGPITEQGSLSASRFQVVVLTKIGSTALWPIDVAFGYIVGHLSFPLAGFLENYSRLRIVALLFPCRVNVLLGVCKELFKIVK